MLKFPSFAVEFSSGRFNLENSARLNNLDNTVKRKLSVLETNSTLGDRLIKAFGTDDKAFIAKTLGFTSVQGVYKVINGTRELDFEKLKKFRDYTKCSIDWLLTGEGSMALNGSREFDLERSVELHDDWRGVMQQWYEFEGGEMPDTLGASFMGGWRSFNREQKIDAIRDLKKLLDMAIADD